MIGLDLEMIVRKTWTANGHWKLSQRDLIVRGNFLLQAGPWLFLKMSQDIFLEKLHEESNDNAAWKFQSFNRGSNLNSLTKKFLNKTISSIFLHNKIMKSDYINMLISNHDHKNRLSGLRLRRLYCFPNTIIIINTVIIILWSEPLLLH